MGTEREVNELLVHPDIIKNLRVGQCILLRHNPTKLDLINIRDRRMEIVSQDNKGKKDKVKKQEVEKLVAPVKASSNTVVEYK
jgi:hypothetical protein